MPDAPALFSAFRRGSWSKRPANRSSLMRTATRAIVVGGGEYTITRNGKPLFGGARAQQGRLKTLRAVRDALPKLDPGDVLRVRSPKRVVFSAKRLHPDPVDDLASLRADIVRFWRFVIAHQITIHYSQTRPFPIYAPGDSTMTLDCSGMAITIARWSGAENPSGSAPGYGNSNSIAAHGTAVGSQIPRSKLNRGDYVTFGNPTTHVAVCIEPGADPLMGSHGSEGAPVAIRLSAEERYHAGQVVRCWALRG